MNRLEQEVSQNHINEFIRRTIIDMSKKVLDHISIDHEKMREGVRKTMGGQVLEHEAKTILRKGSNDKLAEQITKKLQKGHDITRIADALEETEERITEIIEAYNLQ